ncbi:biotin/lipoyl-containing protein [Rhodococcus sp. JS3073]|uniref:acyl carrier protein n=1 Tax=Rhodococcus sp. JS3073 TaxID=3002901 RepID=UPI003FA722F5
MVVFALPSLGSDLDDGTLIDWLVKPGDEVDRGQAIATVDTVKAAVDVEIWRKGTIHRLLVLLNAGSAAAEPGVTVHRARDMRRNDCEDSIVDTQDIGAVVLAALPSHPEVVLADQPHRDQVDLDSLDWLNFLVRLHSTFGIDIPEADYGRLVTLTDVTDYAAARVTHESPGTTRAGEPPGTFDVGSAVRCG